MEKIRYHPILFSTPMVQAILEGRKTQTRRTKGLEVINKNPNKWRFNRQTNNLDYSAFKTPPGLFIFLDDQINTTALTINCPYNVGDVLWVRETFTKVPDFSFAYKALLDNDSEEIRQEYLKMNQEWAKWKPSIFMPKEACRIFLKIKSIRAERLSDINEEDAIAEGAIQYEKETDWMSAKYGFQMIWETINGKESWCFNPFVWVYEFERIEKPNDFI